MGYSLFQSILVPEVAKCLRSLNPFSWNGDLRRFGAPRVECVAECSKVTVVGDFAVEALWYMFLRLWYDRCRRFWNLVVG